MLYIFCLVVLFLNSRVTSFIVPKLLLPYYDQIQANYTINAEEGCYKWSSQNPDVATIEPIPKDSSTCTASAIIFVQSKSPSRRITLILAENEVTGTVLQCDVIVERIVAIDIISRTRELYLDDPPETLHVRALDSEGNTFSSTAYMLFDWKLLPDEESNDAQAIPPHRILHIGKFIETDYAAEPYVEQLERQGLQSDTILLSGVQTGTAYVRARLSSSLDIMTAKIGIVVRDKVFLIPNGVVWIPRHGMIQYRVEKWRNGKPTEVKMPNQQYFLQLSDTVHDEEGEEEIVSLDTDTSVVIGLRLGNTELFLMDRNLKTDTIQDSCDINVVEPAYIRFSIQPDDRWVLETSRYYIILIHVYDSENHRLYPCSNFRISTSIDPLYFKIIDSSDNGTWHSVQTLQKGVTELYAKLNGVVHVNGEIEIYHPVIDATQIAEIFDPITVKPPILVFPWHPKPVLHRYKLKACGGSGNYTWSIDNDTFAFVSSNGMVTTKVGPEQEKILPPATAEVRATDVRNPSHWGSSRVYILPVVEILFARSYREAEVETYLDLYLTMHAVVDGELVPVADCRKSGVQWHIQDPTIFKLVEDVSVEIPEIDGTIACVGVRLKGLKEGYTQLGARYVQDLPDERSQKFEASVTIVAFPPLKAIDPVSVAVVSLDSRKLLRFKGGPLRWPLWHSGHERQAITNSTSITQISPVHSSYQEHQLIAHCMDLGISQVTLSVFNKPCNTNPMPVTASVSVRVWCDIPHHLGLIVSSLLPTCPLHHVDVLQTVALIEKTFSINMTLYNSYDLMFDNFTSIESFWSSSSKLTNFSAEDDLFTPVDNTLQRKHIVTKEMQLPSLEGEQIVTVSLTKYKAGISSEICKHHNCQEFETEISATVSVLVVSPPIVSPPSIFLFNHENFSLDVRVLGGSGYFDHVIEQDLNFTVILESHNAYIKLAPLRAGTSTLSVIDLCMSTEPVTKATVQVLEVGRLILVAPPRLALDGTAVIRVEAEDNYGRPLPAHFLPYLNIVIESSVKDILEFGPVGGLPSAEALTAQCNITGLNVGTTMITAVSKRRDGSVIRSNAVHIVVISLLELLPPVITLIKHSEFQLRTVGGPRSDFTMRFTVEDENLEGPVVDITQSGVIHALRVGTTRVSAEAVMHDGFVFFSKRPTIVNVVQLDGIRIDAPLTQYHVGGTIPLHVNGITDDQNPMSFGSAVPGLDFKWESANPSVVKLHTVHAKAGIETKSNLSFTVLAEGVSSGHCVITVVVTPEDITQMQLSQDEFRAEISLMIYDPLAIISTESCSAKQWRSTSKFLMTPSTVHQLQTNRDGVAKYIHYTTLTDQKCIDKFLDDDDDFSTCVNVNDRGRIRSGPNQCEVTMLVTSVERFGVNQTLSLHVLVRPVAYTIARAVTEFRTREHTPTSFAFPLGASVRFVVDQFDDAADKFDATAHDVILNLNRYDRVEIEPESGNRSFNLRLPLEGTTIMSVESYLESTTSPSSVYYFPVNVLPALRPQEQKLTIGLKFCFVSEFINLNGSDGSWSADHQKLLASPQTGAVLAVGRVTSTIKYIVDNLEASALVTATPFIANLADGRLTGPILSKYVSYYLPIRVSPGYAKSVLPKCDGLEKEMINLAAKLFICSVRFTNSNIDGVYTAKPEFSTKTGVYSCVVERREFSAVDRKQLATINDTLLVTLSAFSNNLGSVQHGATSLLFYPSFYSELSSNNLTPGSHVMFCVFSVEAILASLKMIPCDPDLLQIYFDEVGISGEYCYRVSTDNKDVTIRTAYFRVVSHLTEQDEKIDLLIDRVAGRLVASPSPCSSADQTMWRGATDMIADTYLAYLSSLSVVIISAALLLAAFTAYRWVTNNSLRPSSSFISRNPPPYDPNMSLSSTPRSAGSPGSTPKVRLWSRYYQPQQASPSTG